LAQAQHSFLFPGLVSTFRLALLFVRSTAAMCRTQKAASSADSIHENGPRKMLSLKQLEENFRNRQKRIPEGLEDGTKVVVKPWSASERTLSRWQDMKCPQVKQRDSMQTEAGSSDGRFPYRYCRDELMLVASRLALPKQAGKNAIRTVRVSQGEAQPEEEKDRVAKCFSLNPAAAEFVPTATSMNSWVEEYSPDAQSAMVKQLNPSALEFTPGFVAASGEEHKPCDKEQEEGDATSSSTTASCCGDWSSERELAFMEQDSAKLASAFPELNSE